MDDLIDFTYEEFIEIPLEYTKKARVFAVDKGGSLAKVGYLTQSGGKNSTIRLVTLKNNGFDAILAFIQNVVLKNKAEDEEIEAIVTGNVAHLLCDAMKEKYGYSPRVTHEFTALIRGFTFSVSHFQESMFHVLPNTLFPTDEDVKYPAILATMGSVTSIKCIQESGSGQMNGGCMTGGLFFGAMCTLLGNKMSYEEMMEHAANGDMTKLAKKASEISEDNQHALPPTNLQLPNQPFAKVLSDDSLAKRGSNTSDKINSILYYVAEETVTAATRAARAVDVDTVCYGGSFGHKNPVLAKYIEEITYQRKKLDPDYLIPKPRFLANGPYLGIIGAVVLILEGEKDDSKIFSIDIGSLIKPGEDQQGGEPGGGPPGRPGGSGPPDFLKMFGDDGPPPEMIEKLLQNPPPGMDPSMLENLKKTLDQKKK